MLTSRMGVIAPISLFVKRKECQALDSAIENVNTIFLCPAWVSDFVSPFPLRLTSSQLWHGACNVVQLFNSIERAQPT